MKKLALIVLFCSVTLFSQNNSKFNTNLEVSSLYDNDDNDIVESIYGRFEKRTIIEKGNFSIVSDSVINSNIIYLSVLRYNDKIIDICPIFRNADGEWNFDEIIHSIDKNKMNSDDIVELISKYEFELNEDKLLWRFNYGIDLDRIKFPNYLKRTTEVIRLK